MLDTGCWILDTGYWILDAWTGILGAGDAGCWRFQVLVILGAGDACRFIIV